MNCLQTTIDIGISLPFRAMHLSDSHICLADEREDARKRALAVHRATVFDEGVSGRTEQYLREQLAYVDEHHMPILYTGDFCDFVSARNLESMKDALCTRECFMAAGNHEYSLYVGEAFEDEAYKMQSYDRVQAFCPNNLRFASRVMHGINFVAVDNVYYNFTTAQLVQLQNEIARGLPIVLMMHTPIYTMELRDYVMDELKQPCAYLVGTPDDEVATYSPDRRIQQQTDAPTRAFIDYALNQPLVRAVLAGHLHYDFETRLPGGTMQYVTGGGFRGCAREILFV